MSDTVGSVNRITEKRNFRCVEGCEFWTDSYADMQKHIKDGCNRHFRPCQYACGNGFATAEEKADHEQDCWNGEIVCDYCGTYFSPMRGYNDHLAACKKKYFNIPLYKILSAIENFIKTTDWNSIIIKVVDVLKSVLQKVIPVVTDLVAKVATPAPEAAPETTAPAVA